MNDGREWSQWMRRHAPAMVLLARQIVPRRDDAEDVVQEAFVRFWARYKVAEPFSSREIADPVAYMFTCVRNTALDWRRAERRREQRESTAADRCVSPGSTPMLDDNAETDERRVAIEAAVATLPQDQREVLVMKIWAKLSFPQIAEALRIPPDTAASRYRYALAKLRERLAEELIR